MARVNDYDRKLLVVWNAMPLAEAPEIEKSFASKVTSDLDAIFPYEHGEERISLILDLGLMNKKGGAATWA